MYKIIERKTETKSIKEVKLSKIYLFILKDYFEPERIKDDKYVDWLIIQGTATISNKFCGLNNRSILDLKDMIRSYFELYDIFECESFMEAFNYIKEGK